MPLAYTGSTTHANPAHQLVVQTDPNNHRRLYHNNHNIKHLAMHYMHPRLDPKTSKETRSNPYKLGIPRMEPPSPTQTTNPSIRRTPRKKAESTRKQTDRTRSAKTQANRQSTYRWRKGANRFLNSRGILVAYCHWCTTRHPIGIHETSARDVFSFKKN